MRPLVGARNLVRRLKQVVLPAPFGPISAWIVPRATLRFTPFTATKPANSLVRSSVTRIAPLPSDTVSSLYEPYSPCFRRRGKCRERRVFHIILIDRPIFRQRFSATTQDDIRR